MKILIVFWMLALIPVCLFVTKVRSTAGVLAIAFFLFPLSIMITSYVILTITVKMSWTKMGANKDLKTKNAQVCVMII